MIKAEELITTEILEKIGFEPSENNLYLHNGIECFYRYKTDNYKIYIILFKVQGEWKLECGRFFGETGTHPLVSENEVKVVVKYIHEIQHALKLCGIKEEIKL